jgi:hypothetical protein
MWSWLREEVTDQDGGGDDEENCGPEQNKEQDEVFLGRVALHRKFPLALSRPSTRTASGPKVLLWATRKLPAEVTNWRGLVRAPKMMICAGAASENDPGPGCARTPEWKLYKRES